MTTKRKGAAATPSQILLKRRDEVIELIKMKIAKLLELSNVSVPEKSREEMIDRVAQDAFDNAVRTLQQRESNEKN